MSRSPVRVLLDVTQLGLVQHHALHPLHRVGIHRVVEQTVASLSTSPDAALTLCAREFTDDAIAFLDAHPALRRVPFRPARKQLRWRLRTHLLARRDAAGGHPPTALPLRAVNSALAYANRGVDAVVGPAGRIARIPADVFHSPVYALPPAAERARGVPHFLTVYDVIPFLLPELSFHDADAWLRRILESLGPDDHVVAISEHTRRDLLGAWPSLDPARVHVAPLAADPGRFYPCLDADRVAATRARHGIPDAPYVLAVGTLEPRKNLPHLLRAFADLCRAERLDDLHLVLTGARGWKHEALDEAIGGHDDVRDRVILTGYVDDADLAPLYTGALVFVYPSLYEGFGLPPLEAMQCGTPAITGNTSSLPEVVGDAGIMVDPRDGDALAAAILRVYRDSAERARLSERSLARAAQFTWERFAACTVAAYRSAL